MKNKRLYILGGLFVLLLGYVVLTQTGQRGYNTVKLPAFKAPAADDLKKITLEQPSGTISFEKKDQDWMITAPFAFAADKNKMNMLTRTIADMRLTDKISNSSEAAADFGLNTVAAHYLQMTDQKGKTVSLYLGKANSDRTHTFAKLKDNPAIYQVLGTFSQYFNYKPEDWRSMSIFDFSRDKVDAVEIEQHGRKKVTMTKQEEVQPAIVKGSAQGVTPAALPSKMVWKATGEKKPLQEAKVDQFLNTFTRLSASAIVDGSKPMPKHPLGEITVKTKTGDYHLTFLSYDKHRQVYLVKGPSDQVLYELSDYQGKNLLKTLKEFIQ